MLAAAAPVSAQRIELAGEGDVALDRRLARLLRSGDYLLVTRDTLIARDDSVPRSVLVLEATFTLEGVVAGDLVGVDANVFLRPGARVHGDAVNISGGLYRSELAQVDGSVVDLPEAPYRVVREGEVVRIEGQREPAALKLDGIMGFQTPTYDRVDALGLRWGASYALPRLQRAEPRLHGQVGYASGRGALTGGLELALHRGANTLALGAEEVTETNEEWIRGDLKNSAIYALAGKDLRDYYEAERAYAQLSRRFGRGARFWTARLRGQLERAESLGATHPWTLFEDSLRPNPPIDDGTIASLIVGAGGEWEGAGAVFEGDARIEFAGTALSGDFSFAALVLQGEWAMQALANHTLELEWYFQRPLPGTAVLPRQRWSFVGGSSTLRTFEIAQFRGDHVVFVESDYIIPLPRRLRLPLLGAPDLHLLHAVGMAWTEATERDLEQNIGASLQFFGPYLRVLTNPADPLDELDVDIGLSLPGGGYPWQRKGR